VIAGVVVNPTTLQPQPRRPFKYGSVHYISVPIIHKHLRYTGYMES